MSKHLTPTHLKPFIYRERKFSLDMTCNFKSTQSCRLAFMTKREREPGSSLSRNKMWNNLTRFLRLQL